jgi:hypothetical protein
VGANGGEGSSAVKSGLRVNFESKFDPQSPTDTLRVSL